MVDSEPFFQHQTKFFGNTIATRWKASFVCLDLDDSLSDVNRIRSSNVKSKTDGWKI